LSEFAHGAIHWLKISGTLNTPPSTSLTSVGRSRAQTVAWRNALFLTIGFGGSSVPSPRKNE
jgi:hypothetical protein